MSLLAVALEYLRSGLTVIPIKLDGTKSPALGKWRHLHEHPPSESAVTHMFRDRDVGLAVLAGKTSGNLTIIDFDRPGSFDAWHELLECMAPGLLERLPVVSTAGGHHVYLRAPICLGNTKLAVASEKYRKPWDDQSKPPIHDVIIETRGQGGYVVAPPSPAEVHVSNIAYRHLSGPPLTQIPLITDDEYNTLLNAARAFNEKAAPAKEERQTAKTSKPNEGAKPGEDFDARASWFEVLEPHGWEAIRTIGDKTYWRRPGKKDGGISATTGHCGSKLYVFSSNAQPFDAERAYNKFSAYGLLNCNGDYSEASRQLRAKGYGAARAPRGGEPMHRPSPDRWAPVDAPPPSEHDMPPDLAPEPAIERLTADRLEAMLDDDPSAAFLPGVFERLLAMRDDRAEWVRIGDVLRRKKKKSDFNAAVKAHDGAQKRKAYSDGWKKEMLFRENKDGDMIAETCLNNIALVLTHDQAWAGVLAFDDFSSQIVTRRAPPFARRSLRWSDEDALEIKVWIERNYPMRPNFNLTCEAILVVAKRASFSSQREYLDQLEPSDGEPSIDTWLIDCFGAPDSRYTREVGRKWLIAAVARAYEPGCKVDNVLVLEGKQGLKKSRALQQLCPNPSWFTDGLSELGSKAQAEEIEGKWIVELGELKGVGRDLDQTKAFVTRQAENYRPAYGRYSIHSPRKCIFAGTVNPGNVGYLKDETGNRRFWPVLCTKQSPEITPALRDKLWSEAKALYQAGEHWWIEDEALLEEAQAEQEARAAVDPWHESIEHYVIGRPDIGTEEIFSDCLKLEKGKWDNAGQQRIGRVLMQLKWTRGRRRDPITGRPRWRYCNPNGDEMSPTGGNGHDVAGLFPS